MSDTTKKFHEFALHSSLFKGRNDLYFSYLKGEKIAHAFCILRNRGESPRAFETLLEKAGDLPRTILRYAAGELSCPAVLADIFVLLSLVKFYTIQEIISKENGAIFIQEYELLAEKLGGTFHPSLYLREVDFDLPAFALESPVSLTPPQDSKTTVKDIQGHLKRTSFILDFVLKNKGVSVKNIASVVKDCGEKTIQRDLNALIKKGTIRKQGERRWSLYFPATDH